ncbi:carbohydrate binding family 6 [Xylogone sp. PMI_703]|nr:carbohydrate binding family 6 [Xylogone sp. PMI_703]
MSLNIKLQNTTTSSTVYAYITGQAIDNNNALFLLQADGRTPYYPASPASALSQLGANCAIPLGAPGNTVQVTIPHIAGGRIWVSIDKPLVFLLSPGPALVEPSVSNASDPNIQIRWDFCEFTYNSAQLFANITYVDFLSIPISLSLTNTSGSTQHVSGILAGGLDKVCAQLSAQHAADGAGWDKLIVTSGGQNLRALSPNMGIVMNPSLFSGYYDNYVNQVWSQYSTRSFAVNTQAQFGTVSARVQGGLLVFEGAGSYAKPSTGDIFSNSTGPFVFTPPALAAITPRLAAGFNRSTLLTSSVQPSGSPTEYYKNPVTNHYSRIIHAVSADGRGYAFPFDDVVPDGGVDQAGTVYDPNPAQFTVYVGGSSSSSGTGGTGGNNNTVGGISAFSQIQAASHTSNNGTQTETTTDTGGGSDVGWIHNGCWLGYANVDFGSSGAKQFTARVASGAASGISGLVQVALDSPTAKPVGSFAIASTGGWQTWKTVSANISTITGKHTVYLVFSSGQPADFVNIHWFTFSSPGTLSRALTTVRNSQTALLRRPKQVLRKLRPGRKAD